MYCFTFPSNYFEARKSFLSALKNVDAKIYSYPIISDELCIDVAIIGKNDSCPTLIISSGLHGVEGFLGSAIQYNFLTSLQEKEFLLSQCRIVLIHSINPYGFAKLRRVNENNVDLNRNFLDDFVELRGNLGYEKLDIFLNHSDYQPKSDFAEKFKCYVDDIGIQEFKQAIAFGQYHFPLGIFYGGDQESASSKIIKNNIMQWCAKSKRVVHLDIHTGLGVCGEYKLLMTDSETSKAYKNSVNFFKDSKLEPRGREQATSYEISGSMGQWLVNKFSNCDYYFYTAEFGTYPLDQVLKSLIDENFSVNHPDKVDEKMRCLIKNELVECFLPSNKEWANKVWKESDELIGSAISLVIS